MKLPSLKRARRLPAEDESSAAEPRTDVFTADGVWYVFMTIVLVIVAFAGIVASASVSPRFCATCHSAESRALAESKHAGTSCDSCHVSTGALGIVENRLRVISMVAEAPFMRAAGGGPDGMDNDACLKCHQNVTTGSKVTNGVVMNHHAPQDQGWLCSRCHSGTAHARTEAGRASYTMEYCLSCHSAGTDNLATCTTCHPEGQQPTSLQNTPWKVTHGSRWQQTHGMGDLQSCKACHGPDYCVACHDMQLPHPATFMSTHGMLVKDDTDKAKCTKCHKGSSCDACHGIEMPHPKEFILKHKTIVKERGEAFCQRCHKAEQCTQCHVRHTHPGIPTDQLQKLKDNPVSVK